MLNSMEILPGNIAELEVEIPVEEVNAVKDRLFETTKADYKIPGYPKGQAPREEIEAIYGDIFLDKAVESLMQDAFDDACINSQLDIVSYPDFEFIQKESGLPVLIKIKVAIKPKVFLGNYKGLELKKINVQDVEHEEVEEMVKRAYEREIEYQKQQAMANSNKIEVTDRLVQMGDEIVFDFEGFVDGKAFDGGKAENFTLGIGSGSFIPGFEEGLIGAELEKEVDVNVTFPINYGSTDLAGKPAVFKCKVHKILVVDENASKDVEAPEVDYEYFKSQYYNQCQQILQNQKLQMAQMEVLDDLYAQLINECKVDVSDLMLRDEIASIKSQYERNLSVSFDEYVKMIPDENERKAFIDKLQTDALISVKMNLILLAIAEKEGLEITQNEIDEVLEGQCAQSGLDMETMRNMYSGANLDYLKGQLLKDKALQLIIDNQA